jgi:hypothetical protein
MPSNFLEIILANLIPPPAQPARKNGGDGRSKKCYDLFTLKIAAKRFELLMKIFLIKNLLSSTKNDIVVL